MTTEPPEPSNESLPGVHLGTAPGLGPDVADSAAGEGCVVVDEGENTAMVDGRTSYSLAS